MTLRPAGSPSARTAAHTRSSPSFQCDASGTTTTAVAIASRSSMRTSTKGAPPHAVGLLDRERAAGIRRQRGEVDRRLAVGGQHDERLRAGQLGQRLTRPHEHQRAPQPAQIEHYRHAAMTPWRGVRRHPRVGRLCAPLHRPVADRLRDVRQPPGHGARHLRRAAAAARPRARGPRADRAPRDRGRARGVRAHARPAPGRRRAEHLGVRRRPAGDRAGLGDGQRAARRRDVDAPVHARDRRLPAGGRVKRAVLLAALLVTGCGSPSADLFLVKRSGADKNANLTLLVSDDGTVTCNGAKHEIPNEKLLDARKLTRELSPQAELHLALPPRPGTVLSYKVRMEAGTVTFSDTSRPLPSEFTELELFTKSVAEDVCGLARA